MKDTYTPELNCYNFRTREYDYNPDLTSDANARQYIPQDAATQGVYDRRRELGQSILDAMEAALTAVMQAATKGGPEA